MKTITALLIFFSLVAPAAAQIDPRAQSVFSQYQRLWRAFDPAVTDLYCPTALIRNVRTYPFGKERVMEIPAQDFVALIHKAMPLAQSTGDYSTYSDITFTQENGNVRINAVRYSVRKDYSSPFSLLVGQCGDRYGLLEELSHSKP